jgi:pimeloyl-ACP methyl ester carboxylesterase
LVAALAFLTLASCSGAATTTGATASSSAAATTVATPSSALEAGRADIGGYTLAYQCEGSGSPTVLLEAGYTASGIGTFGQTIQPALAHKTRVCTYDRAGIGVSDPRPASVTPLTSITQARELHALLDAIGEHGPFVYVGHSYGGMIARAFAAAYPEETVGLVLLDASSEPEIPVYHRLHAGPWNDGTVYPAPNQRIDIDQSVRELEDAGPLGATPLIVVTAGILEDQWLATVPHLEAQAQTRLASLSSNSIHVLDRGKGHSLPDNDPTLVIDATLAVIHAARSGAALPRCESVFADVPTARCLARGELGNQEVRPSG